jgi:hypothetical protein
MQTRLGKQENDMLKPVSLSKMQSSLARLFSHCVCVCVCVWCVWCLQVFLAFSAACAVMRWRCRVHKIDGFKDQAGFMDKADPYVK